MFDQRWPDSLLRSVSFVLTAAVLAMAQTAGAQSVDVFEVEGVAVDVTAGTAAEARELALAEGEIKAFRRLLERLTMRADHGRLPSLSRDQVAAYVKDFDVAEEKTSPVRYLAKLNFRFRPRAVRRLLTDHGVGFAETPSKPVLVLPVYQAAGALLLWDDPNPWYDAWKARPPLDGLVSLVLPLGDLTDISAIGAEQAVNGDGRRLSAIAGRYGVGGTLVARGVLGIGGPRGLPELEVFVARRGTLLEEQTIGRTFSSTIGESIDDLLRRAVAEIAILVEDNWKRENQLRFGRSAILAVTVPIGGLPDWLEVRRRLSGVAVVRIADLVLMSRDEVRVNLHYIGDAEQLALALEQADLVLTSVGDDNVLGLAERAPAGES